MNTRRKAPASPDDETPTQRGARKAIELLWLPRRSLTIYSLDPQVRGRKTPRNLLAETIESLPDLERRGALWVLNEVLVMALEGHVADEEYLTSKVRHIPEEAPPRTLPARRPLRRQ